MPKITCTLDLADTADHAAVCSAVGQFLHAAVPLGLAGLVVLVEPAAPFHPDPAPTVPAPLAPAS